MKYLLSLGTLSLAFSGVLQSLSLHVFFLYREYESSPLVVVRGERSLFDVAVVVFGEGH